jgi:hypothetical protein
MAIAIISRVNELTQILALLVVATHCVVIFWPRKPIAGPTDKDGMPIPWHNDDGSRRDIACVWQEGSSEGTTAVSGAAAEPMTSFSETVQPLRARTTESERSAA